MNEKNLRFKLNVDIYSGMFLPNSRNLLFKKYVGVGIEPGDVCFTVHLTISNVFGYFSCPVCLDKNYTISLLEIGRLM